MLRAIALLKCLQAITLFGVALAAHQLLRPDVAVLLQAWVRDLPVQGEQELLHIAGRWVGGLLPRQVAGIGVGAFCYGVLVAVESIGLWHRKIWAEWLTVVATSLLIPVELWEVFTRMSLASAGVLALNVAVVWYLLRQLQRTMARHRAVAAEEARRMVHDSGADAVPFDVEAPRARRSA